MTAHSSRKRRHSIIIIKVFIKGRIFSIKTTHIRLRACTHTHTHMCTHTHTNTHRHASRLTIQNLKSELKMGSKQRLEMDEDRSMEWKTWKAYGLGKRRVF